MKLTPEETDRAAQRLARQIGHRWDTLTDHNKTGFRLVVEGLADKLDVEHSPEAVRVFMLWMGDD